MLLSHPTRDLVSVDVRDLGEHRLKDLPRHEHIYQLGDATFAPLATLGRTNLSVATTCFVDDRRDRDGLTALLAG